MTEKSRRTIPVSGVLHRRPPSKFRLQLTAARRIAANYSRRSLAASLKRRCNVVEKALPCGARGWRRTRNFVHRMQYRASRSLILHACWRAVSSWDFLIRQFAVYPWLASFSMLWTRQKNFHCPSTLVRLRSVNRSSPLLYRMFAKIGSTVASLQYRVSKCEREALNRSAAGGDVDRCDDAAATAWDVRA